MRGVNNTLDTINAAATAIASSENRVPQASIQKRRWGSCWSIYWCFGSHKQRNRIGHAVSPETTAPRTYSPASENPTQTPSIEFPFVAPPSSPASFIQSEPPSASQSPAGSLSLLSISANMYSPSGPSSIFAIGPYAHETQLVSPPMFSTEPSTAPFTPPPESVHLTTPSSPEVPFAQLLGNGEAGQRFPLSHYEFQSHQFFYPGSPVGHLISPSSGTSSPFPDCEIAPGGPHFLEFQTGDLVNGYDCEDGQRHQKHRSITLGSVMEFNFDSADGENSDKPNADMDWRANEKVLQEEVEPCKNWSFPMIQPGVS